MNCARLFFRPPNPPPPSSAMKSISTQPLLESILTSLMHIYYLSKTVLILLHLILYLKINGFANIDCHSAIPPTILPLTVSSARRSRVILKKGIFNYIQPLRIKGQLLSHPSDVSVLQLLWFKKTAGELHCKVFRRRCFGSHCKKAFLSNG